MKHVLAKVSIIFSISFLLFACAATGEKFAPQPAPKNSSLVYIYRPNQFAASAVSYDIYFDGVKKGNIRNGGYAMFEILPGSHTVTVKNWQEEPSIVLSVGKGQKYYLRADFKKTEKMGRVYTNNMSFLAPVYILKIEQVPSDIALRDLSSLHSSQ